MIARYTCGILGLLALSVSIVVGLWAHNPVSLILSRAIWALCVFCVIGLVVGGVAQYVVNDYAKRRQKEVLAEPDETPPPEQEEEPIINPIETQSKPMGT